MHVYADGSKLDEMIICYVCDGIHSEHFPHYLPLGTERTTFEGEVAAIYVTLQHLNAWLFLFDWAVVFSD